MRRLHLSLVHSQLPETIRLLVPDYRPRRVIFDRVPDLGVFFTLYLGRDRFLNIDWVR